MSGIRFIDVILYIIVVPIVTVVLGIIFVLLSIEDKLHPDMPLAYQEESSHRIEYPVDFDGFLLNGEKP
jgi:hypothetical protein